MLIIAQGAFINIIFIDKTNNKNSKSLLNLHRDHQHEKRSLFQQQKLGASKRNRKKEALTIREIKFKNKNNEKEKSSHTVLKNKKQKGRRQRLLKVNSKHKQQVQTL